MNALKPADKSKSLQTTAENRLDENPAAVYLAGLSPSSRRTMEAALDTIARLGLGDERVTCWDVPRHQLRFQHTQAVKSALAEQYAHNTANRMLSALGVRLGTEPDLDTEHNVLTIGLFS